MRERAINKFKTVVKLTNPKENTFSFAECLWFLRILSGLDQNEFAEQIEILPITYASYEKGLREPKIAIVKQIADKCKVPIAWLCGEISQEELNNILNIIISDNNPVTWKAEKICK